MKTKPPDRGKSQATSSINDAAEHLSAADATSVRSPGWLIRHAKLLIGEGKAGEDLQSALLEHTGPLPEGWTIAAALKALEAAIRMGTMARGAIVLPARDAAQRSKELLQEQLVQLLDTGTPLPKALRDEGLAARDLNAARATAQSFSHSHADRPTDAADRSSAGAPDTVRNEATDNAISPHAEDTRSAESTALADKIDYGDRSSGWILRQAEARLRQRERGPGLLRSLRAQITRAPDELWTEADIMERLRNAVSLADPTFDPDPDDDLDVKSCYAESRRKGRKILWTKLLDKLECWERDGEGESAEDKSGEAYATDATARGDGADRAVRSEADASVESSRKGEAASSDALQAAAQVGRERRLKAALWYAERGFHVFPCHGVVDVTQEGIQSRVCACADRDCSSPAKHPATKHGLNDATLDTAQIVKWWSARLERNVAIACESSRLVVIDIDPRNGGHENWEKVKAALGINDDTAQVITGSGGTHIYYRSPARVRVLSGQNLLGPGIDLKAAGGYVIAPPSRHLTGKEYAWKPTKRITEIPIAPLPEGLLERLQKLNSNRNGMADLNGSTEPVPPDLDKVRRALPFISPKSRDTWLNVGMALDSGFDGSTLGYEVWTEWSKRAPEKFNENDQKRAWKSFRPDGNVADKITLATLFKLAAEAGFESNAANGGAVPGDVWAQAIPAPDFIKQPENEPEHIVRRLVAPGSFTLLSGTRGLGKTNLGLTLAVACAKGSEFLGDRLEPHRVLLLNRDNPTRTIRKRLREWGAADAPNLEVLGRDKAPPFTDKRAWKEFPANRSEVIVVDSLSAFIEGVDEKEGGSTGHAIASLLDAAAKNNFAILVLANTNRSGKAFRGSGINADRADIVYEARDATDLRLDPKREHWTDCLPDPSDAAWGERAKRRGSRIDYRIALNCTKFRDGDEPDPFVVEIRHDDQAAWSVREVTRDVEAEHERLKETAEAGRKEKIERAVQALKDLLPCAKNTDAVDILVANGLSRTFARRLIADRTGHDWIVSGSGRKGDPLMLRW